MLKRMFFDVTRGGVHSQIDVWVEEGKVYHKARLFNAMPDLRVKAGEPYELSTEWLMRLSRLHLWDLEPHYRSDHPEDVVWSLRYEEQGRGEVLSEGVGEYPPGWDELLLLVDELAPEGEFIDPYLIETLYMTYKSMEETEFGPQEYTEEMTLDRRSQTLRYRRSFADDIYCQTEYKNMNEVSVGLDMWDRFFRDTPQLMMYDMCPIEPARLTVIVDRHEGSQEQYLWHYSRTCLPDAWPRFIGMIAQRLQIATMFTNLINPGFYLHGAKAGELIYCTVKIPSLGRSFYYITNDNSLRRGDKVLVPTGEDRSPTSGEITKIDYYLPENVPFPVEDVEPIYGRDFDVDKEIRK